MKCAEASCSKLISLWALRLASIISTRSSGCWVSDSKTSILCCTPSSKSWKASMGRSGASRAMQKPARVARAKVRKRRGVEIIDYLGCGFCSPRFSRRGRNFAIGPDGAVFKVLLLPDGDGALERVDGEPAGLESRRAVRGADGDKHAGLADFQPAQAVSDGDAVDGEFFMDVGTDFADFRKGHGFVGFVFEIQRGPAVRMIAHAAIEGDDSAVFRGADVPDQSGRVNRLADELVKVVLKR